MTIDELHDRLLGCCCVPNKNSTLHCLLPVGHNGPHRARNSAHSFVHLWTDPDDPEVRFPMHSYDEQMFDRLLP